jgi:hypothetical protein
LSDTFQVSDRIRRKNSIHISLGLDADARMI